MKLIDNWVHHFWRLWTIRLAAFGAILASALLGHIDVVYGLLVHIGEPYKTVIAIVVGALVFIVPSTARLVQQKPSTETPNADSN